INARGVFGIDFQEAGGVVVVIDLRGITSVCFPMQRLVAEAIHHGIVESIVCFQYKFLAAFSFFRDSPLLRSLLPRGRVFHSSRGLFLRTMNFCSLRSAIWQ